MPPKRTPKKRSGRPSPKTNHIDDETWQSVIGEELVIDTAKKTYVGKLLRFTKGSLELSPKTTIAREMVIAFCQAKDAPSKSTA